MSTYSLAPKKADSRVKSLTVTVNDASALVMQVRWLYTNGGQLEFTQTYTKVQQFSLPSEVNITARFPGYSVDGTLSFSNYRPNASVSPGKLQRVRARLRTLRAPFSHSASSATTPQ